MEFYLTVCLNLGDRAKIEHSAWVNTTLEGIEFVRNHPEYREEYQKFTVLDAEANQEVKYH